MRWLIYVSEKVTEQAHNGQPNEKSMILGQEWLKIACWLGVAFDVLGVWSALELKSRIRCDLR